MDDVSRRIHDGVPLEQLTTRADSVVATMRSLFNLPNSKSLSILEIGSGLGYLMEAVDRQTCSNPHRPEIVGLDISESMSRKAQQRLSENPASKSGLFKFAIYDGLTVPFDDGRFDFIYSVATLQHIPKPHVYNLFFEIKRLLNETGFGVLQFLPFSILPEQEKTWPWKREIQQQLGMISSNHWHHYYSEDEIRFVLEHGTGFRHVQITRYGGNLWTCVSKQPRIKS